MPNRQRSPFTARREALGLTQKQLAARAKCAHWYVAFLETGRLESPRLDVSERLRRAMKMEAGDWFNLLRRNAKWGSTIQALREPLRVA